MLTQLTHDITTMSRRRWLAATAGLVLGLATFSNAKAQETIKVGVLHSLSGTMAISETTLKDTVLFLIDEQNKKGGVLGKKLEAVVVDPASNWPLFAEKARELITKDKVSVVFGCWTSVSRKSVLPVFKELNSILFYPVQYEGEESERNVFYTGAAPNQQAIPAVDYLMKDEKVKRWVLAGTDYVYPRTTNKILEAYLKSKGVKQEDIMINYTPFGHSDWQTIVADIKKFGSAGKKTAVVSTINGDANVPFYKELGNQGIKATDIPVVAFSVGEEELAGIDTKPLLGHLAAWNYFQSIKDPGNEKFIKAWQAYTKNPKRVTNDPMEAHVIGFEMWVKAVEKVKSTDADKVIDALPGIEAKNLTGGTSKMLPNHHITKPVFIGEIKANGQFDVVWKTPGLVAGDAWSKELDGSKDLIGDWVGKKCGNYNTKTNKCGGQGTIKVGILHSLSGTMAISETTLKDVMLMLIDEQNKKGGVLGKKLEAVVVDPASNWPLFAEKARELITKDKVAAVFGCWTSVSRKSVLPVFEELNGMLFYPVQYEGEESERNVFYTGAAPNQQAIPAVDYLMKDEQGEALGAGRHRLRLSAHHQQDPRSLSEVEGRQAGRHHDQLHAVRSFRLADDRGRHQEVRLGRQEDGGRVDHQRRRQRAVLQGTRQPGHQGDRHSGRRVLGR